ncbi:glycosyltransferase family 4 protein [Candidatus Peregrinibacteria bacterium]|nr:glycosyltransferase family 4 protein [Candidatus Peregrinibacteria bacterium]
MKRILFYTDTPLLGGAENQMLTLTRFLPKDKFHITLACSNSQKLNSWCQKFLQEGMDVFRLKVFHKHDPRHFFYLKKLLKNCDLMHMHVWNPASGRYGFLASGKIPLVITEHDPFPLTGLKKRLKQKLIQKARRIIVASNAAKQAVLGQNPDVAERITIIPNGIDIAAWQKSAALENRQEFRRIHFKATGHDKVILCVAELHKRKGQKYLIEAVKLLLADFPTLKLILAGDGPERNSYKKLARLLGDRVLFLGQQKHISQLMAATDFFALPSIREAFGLVLLEAASLNIPIVATNTGGIPEIIEHEKTGVLVPPQDAVALTSAFGMFLKNPDIAAKYALAGKSRVEKLFDARIMAAKTTEVYDAL